ncbi:hypothetical protein PGT21_027263 [Puccinia graminis f. sp. tritici]|uniref:Uncharacterized protein n=1 Tax=Puccinia graminis f. sp. tritici TaxID=56615 RepID=A0A5B0R1S9_PUCGR|nr:hypothetical protein PGT21_027263 [Puccinia graminis f. sp. tritici]KAA1120814.1 hypothetical protein PGTUg99_021427 [Puccinia graminis f. sp. tritici]
MTSSPPLRTSIVSNSTQSRKAPPQKPPQPPPDHPSHDHTGNTQHPHLLNC